jgi:long-chain alkane monooxygenase
MKHYATDLNERMSARFNRPPGSVKLIYGLQTVVAETRSEAHDKHERIKACIPPEGAMAWISGHFGLDFSRYSPDDIVQNIEVPGIQGLFKSIIYAKGGAPVTVKEAAMIYAQGMGMPVSVGTASDIADQDRALHGRRRSGRLHVGRDLYAGMFRGVRRPRGS